MAQIARNSRRLQRATVVGLATLIAGLTGVRVPHGRAVPFEGIELQGMGRATLTVEQTAPVPAEGTSVAMEVFARMIYASELSQFGRGLYARATFTIPSTRETGVLVVDVDRSGSGKEWQVGQASLKARMYTLASKDAHGARFDGVARSGALTLDASVVGATQAGFRISGSLEFVDRGSDGAIGTNDDEAYGVDLELESVPPPEQITGHTPPPPPAPTGGVCDPTWCWQDDGYYDGYWYGPGCGDASVGYETTDGGCESDTVVDDPVLDDGSGGGSSYDPYAPASPDTTTDSGCDTSTTTDDGSSSGGCSGTDDTTGSSSDGCGGSTTDSSSTSSGCSDTSSSGSSGCDSGSGATSGCGSSGCEGDTLERAPTRATTSGLEGGLGWIAIGLFFGSLGAVVVGRRDDQ